MPSKTPKQKSFMAAVANNPKFAKKVGVSQQVGKEFEMKDKKKPVKKLAFGGLGGAKMNSAPARNPLAGAQMNSAPARNPLAGAQMNSAPARNPLAGAQMSPSTLQERLNAPSQRNPLAGAQMNANPDNYALAGATINGKPTASLRGTPDRPLTQAQVYNQERAIHKDPSSPFHSQFYPEAGAKMSSPAPTLGSGIKPAGGMSTAQQQAERAGGIGRALGVAATPPQLGNPVPMLGRFAKGGKVKQADGIAKKGKTATKMVKMAKGGSVGIRADGIATRGKTRCKMPGMAKGGMAKKGCK
jgi:hypothetical protein